MSMMPKRHNHVLCPNKKRVKELEAEVERLTAAIALYGPPNCDFLHHKPSDRHRGGVECPVVKRIEALTGGRK